MAGEAAEPSIHSCLEGGDEDEGLVLVYLGLGRDWWWFGVGVNVGISFITLRGQIPGAEAPFQVVDIGGERLSEAAERNGGAVGGLAAIFSALVNFVEGNLAPGTR